MNDVAVVRFQISFESPLHSGYGTQFAAFMKPEDAGGKASVNLETRAKMRRADGQEVLALQPALLATSVKGVFRAASAWLLEKVAQDALRYTEVITCDYLPSAGGMPGHRPLCVLCQGYGGPYREYREGGEGQRSSRRGVLTFSSSQSDALQSETTEERVFQFPNVALRKQAEKPEDRQGARREKPLIIHGLATHSIIEELVIKISPYSEFALTLTCLSADLISSGFFRWGRFTSRGYGLVRLVPQAYSKKGLSELLREGKPRYVAPQGRTGFELAQEITGRAPIEIILEKLRGALAQGPLSLS